MAAPSGTVWGNIVTGSKSTRKGRIGIYTGVNNTDTQTTVSVQVWFWSMYGVSDSSNSYYYNSASTATTLQGSININHTVNSGSGWSTSNQTLLGSKSYTYNKGTSAATKYYSAKLTGIDSVGSSNAMTVSTSVKVPALASYKVKYNPNGGSNAPSEQTKWYGRTLQLSVGEPTRSGYGFVGWATSSSGSVAYSSGANYTANASVTLYAKWTANEYKVKYNANGGTGAPSEQLKTHGINLTLSSTKPTRTNYTFKGWGTSSTSTTVAYAAGATYSNNAAITLYAIWQLAYVKPRIKNVQVYRCNSSGTISDSGTYFKTSFNWETDKTVSSVKIEWKLSTSTSYSSSNSTTISATGTTGTVQSAALGSNAINTEKSYDVKITVADSSGSSSIIKRVAPIVIPLDLLSGGKGIAFGKPADAENLFDVAFPARFTGMGSEGCCIKIEHSISGKDANLMTERTDTGNKIGFGIGSGGINRGIHDPTNGRWLIYTDGNMSVKFGANAYGSESTNTISDIATASSGWSISKAYYIRWGRVAQIQLNMVRTGDAISAGNIGNQTMATVISGKRPYINSALAVTASGHVIGAYLNSSGNVILSATVGTIATNSELSFSGVYILNEGQSG